MFPAVIVHRADPVRNVKKEEMSITEKKCRTRVLTQAPVDTDATTVEGTRVALRKTGIVHVLAKVIVHVKASVLVKISALVKIVRVLAKVVRVPVRVARVLVKNVLEDTNTVAKTTADDKNMSNRTARTAENAPVTVNVTVDKTTAIRANQCTTGHQ